MSRPHPALLAMARGMPFDVPKDADAFIHSAAEHRMTGLIWSRVQDRSLDLPPQMVKAIATEDLATTAHHMRLWSVLEEVTSRLSAAGIEVVTFKGVTDEARWFDRMGERPCSDVDIVIEDIERFDEAIGVLAPHHPLLGHATEMARRGQALSADLWFGDVHVDLHVDSIKIGRGWQHPNEWFQHTQSLSTPSGGEVRVFDDTATALLRLLHLGKDRFRYLLGLVEARRILESHLDWTEMLTLAEQEGFAAPVAVAAEVVADELGDEPGFSSPEGWRTRLWRKMWAPDVRLLGEIARKRFVRRSTWLLPLTMPGRTRESLAWLVYTAFPHPVLLDLKHPKQRGPYVWRLISGRTTYYIRRRLEVRSAEKEES